MNRLPAYGLLPVLTTLSLAVGYVANRLTAGMNFDEPIIADVVKALPLQIVDLIIALIVLRLATDTKSPPGVGKKWLPAVWVGVGLVLGLWYASLRRENVVLASEQWSTAAKWYVAILGIGVAPICEELFFRKMFLDLYPKEIKTACVVSVAMFVFSHNGDILQHALSGTVFVLAYVTTGRLWVPIAMHALTNGVKFALLLG